MVEPAAPGGRGGESPAPPEPVEGAPTRSRLRSLVSFVLLVGSAAYVGHVLFEQRAELARVLELNPAIIVIIFSLMGVSHLQRTYEFTFMLRKLGVREPFAEGFLLTAAGFLLNHLPFNAGLVMRASVLKRDHSLPYASYLALVTVNALVNVSVAALLGLVVTLAEPPETGFAWPLVALFAALLVVAVGSVFLPLTKLSFGSTFLGRHLGRLATGIALIRGNGSSILVLIGVALAKVTGAALRAWLCFELLGAEVSFLGAALLASTTIVFTLVNVTPGNLGLREVVMAAVSTQLGASYAVGMAAASIDRVVLLFYTVVTGLPGLYALRRRGPFRAEKRP
ncbi:MAG TPA: lysylphosphatidylglycerol synthase transmembrane domain-containing protein [Polyangiaceae bacterium]